MSGACHLRFLYHMKEDAVLQSDWLRTVFTLLALSVVDLVSILLFLLYIPYEPSQ